MPVPGAVVAFSPVLDDSVRLAERARDADVVGHLDEADQALERAALFLTQHLQTG
ncbi:hypothetical protein ABZ921_05115 [Streptomyces atriruber]|uniref:HEPN domain-containing protein n=1 Tax=Streptomyces atriruber TaxID=545121 RepID=A0ABV3BG63_9ACTN